MIIPSPRTPTINGLQILQRDITLTPHRRPSIIRIPMIIIPSPLPPGLLPRFRRLPARRRMAIAP